MTEQELADDARQWAYRSGQLEWCVRELVKIAEGQPLDSDGEWVVSAARELIEKGNA